MARDVSDLIISVYILRKEMKKNYSEISAILGISAKNARKYYYNSSKKEFPLGKVISIRNKLQKYSYSFEPLLEHSSKEMKDFIHSIKSKPMNEFAFELIKGLIEVSSKEVVLNKKVSTHEKEVEKLQQSVHELTSVNKELEEKISSYESKLLDQKETKKYDQEISYLQKEIQDLYTDLDTADEEIDECIKIRSTLSQDLEQIRLVVDEKDKLLNIRNSQYEKLAKDFENLHKKYLELDNSEKRIFPTKEEVEAVSIDSLNQLQEQVELIEKLKRRILSKDQEIEELIGRIEIEEIKIEELEEEIESEKRNRLRLENAYNRLKSQLGASSD